MSDRASGLMSAVMKDGNGKLQIVAARLCPSESEFHLTPFLTNNRDYTVKDQERPIIISDQVKGLI